MPWWRMDSLFPRQVDFWGVSGKTANHSDDGGRASKGRRREVSFITIGKQSWEGVSGGKGPTEGSIKQT